MKEIFKNWKSVGVGGAIGALATTLVVGGIKIVKSIKDKKLIEEIDSYEETPSGESESEE